MISLVQLLLEVSIEQLKDQFVTSGKMSQDIFNRIETACDHKSAYMTWMVSKVADGMIPEDQIDNFHEYFDLFSRLKAQFPQKDLGQIKSVEAVNTFIAKAKELQEKVKNDPSKNKGLSRQDKFQQFFLGNVKTSDGVTWRAYKIPKTTDPKRKAELYPVSTELGRGSRWCTAVEGDPSNFNRYINKGDLYIFISPTSKRKYQFSYEDHSFYNETDLEDVDKTIMWELMNYLSKADNRPIPGSYEVYSPENQKAVDILVSSSKMTTIGSMDIYEYNAPVHYFLEFLYRLDLYSIFPAGETKKYSPEDKGKMKAWIIASSGKEKKTAIILYPNGHYDELAVRRKEVDGKLLMIDAARYEPCFKYLLKTGKINKIPTAFNADATLLDALQERAKFIGHVDDISMFLLSPALVNSGILGYNVYIRQYAGNYVGFYFKHGDQEEIILYGEHNNPSSSRNWITPENPGHHQDTISSTLMKKISPCIPYLINHNIIEKCPDIFELSSKIDAKNLSGVETESIGGNDIFWISPYYQRSTYNVLRSLLHIDEPFELPGVLSSSPAAPSGYYNAFELKNNAVNVLTNITNLDTGRPITIEGIQVAYENKQVVLEKINKEEFDNVFKDVFLTKKILNVSPSTLLSESTILTNRFRTVLRSCKEGNTVSVLNSEYDVFVPSRDSYTYNLHSSIIAFLGNFRSTTSKYVISNILNVNDVAKSTSFRIHNGSKSIGNWTGIPNEASEKSIKLSKELYRMCKIVEEKSGTDFKVPLALVRMFGEEGTNIVQKYIPLSRRLTQVKNKKIVGIIQGRKNRTGEGFITTYSDLQNNLITSVLDGLRQNANVYHVKWTTAYVYQNYESANYVIKGEPDSGNPEDLVWWVRYGHGMGGGTQIFKGPAQEIGN